MHGRLRNPAIRRRDAAQYGTTVDVTVSLFSPNFFVRTGAADFQNFKFNADDVVLGDITVDQTVPLQTMAAQTGAFNGNGTGMFVFGIACTTCGNGGSGAFNNDIVFHVASATIADLIAGNNLGNIFVADILSDAAGGEPETPGRWTLRCPSRARPRSSVWVSSAWPSRGAARGRARSSVSRVRIVGPCPRWPQNEDSYPLFFSGLGDHARAFVRRHGGSHP